MIRFNQRPGVLIGQEPIPGSYLVRISQQNLKLTIDLTFDADGAEQVERLVDAYKGLFVGATGPDGEPMHLGAFEVTPPVPEYGEEPVDEPEEVIDAEFEEQEEAQGFVAKALSWLKSFRS